MSKTTDQHIEDLLNLHHKKIDLSLGRMTDLLSKLGNPHLSVPPVIHVAGTNGKGSTSAFSRAILEAAGYSVHVYTSPHLVHWRERYRIGSQNGGRLIENAELIDTLERILAASGKQLMTVFEVLTVAAFLLFSEHQADATILEVGLGGRFDATNVITKSAVSLIMPIALDHQSFLGKKIENIATEKAGIIKKNSPVVIGFQESESVRNILIYEALKTGVLGLVVYGKDYFAYEKHGRMIFQDCDGLMNLPLPSLSGSFQIRNAAAAIEGIRVSGFKVGESAFTHGIANVIWPARMQNLRKGKLFNLLPPGYGLWIDGGHNPSAGAAIAQFTKELCEVKKQKLILVCGMINTKDVVKYLSMFKSIATRLCAVPIHLSDIGILPGTLARLACKVGLESQEFKSISNALEDISDAAKPSSQSLVLICGSLYLAGEALKENGTPPQ